MRSPKYYTHVAQCGNRVIHRFIDENGNRNIELQTPELSLFTKKADGDEKSLYGDKLVRNKFNNINEYFKFKKEYGDVLELFGDVSPEYQFIYNSYSQVKEVPFIFSRIKVANLDIETSIEKYSKGFPKPVTAYEEINAITVSFLGEQDNYTWTILDYDESEDDEADEYSHTYVFETEEEMMREFLKFWQVSQPDAITGWNIKGFDIPYIINRGRRVVGDMINMFSPVSHLTTRDPFRETKAAFGSVSYTILGLDIIDYQDAYDKYNFDTLPDAKLETICQHELGEGKDDYAGYSTMKEFQLSAPTKFVRYNKQDVMLINKLEAKLNYVLLTYILAYEARVNPADCFGQVKFWDIFIYNFLAAEGIQIPPQVHRSKEKVEGAYVREVRTGKVRFVAAFDLTSLN